MDAMNTSALSAGGRNQAPSPGGSNYRRTFKPNLPSTSASQHGPPGSDGHGGGGGFHENPINNRQSLKTNPQSSYEPERRSPNIARR